jgi:SagB-type dehydrogenase family enzyme
MKNGPKKKGGTGEWLKLPKVGSKGGMTLVEALRARRSLREYTKEALKLEELSLLLWAGQGVTGKQGERTAPSAGALFPLEFYVVTGCVQGLAAGTYKYDPKRHALACLATGDVRSMLYRAALRQECVRDGALIIVIAAVYKRTTHTYGERGIRYVHMDTAHAAQNILLQAAALKLGSVVVGAFDDDRVKDTIKMQRNEDPLYLIPVGRVKKSR